MKNQLSENMNLLKRLTYKPKNVIEGYLTEEYHSVIDSSREYKKGDLDPQYCK